MTQPPQGGWPPPPSYPPAYPPYAAWPPAPPPRPPYPHPEPREFHQMFRTWTYAWWRPFVGIILLAAGMLIVLPLAMMPILIGSVLIDGGEEDFLDAFFRAGTFQELTPGGLLYLNLSLGGLILWTWALIRVLHQMRPRWLSSVVPKLRWDFVWISAGFAVIALAASIGVSFLVPESAAPDTSGVNEVTGRMIALAVIVLLTTPLQAAGEEYAFRGYLLQAVGSMARNKWIAIILTATLFAMAHGLQNFPLFFDRFMFGVISAWLVIRTGGLEAAIAMHVLNNLVAFGFALAFDDIDATLSVSEISWWNIPVTLTQSVVFAGLVVWAANRRGLQRRTVVPQLTSTA